MYIITGFGRTGTSIVAGIYDELGYAQGVWSEEFRGGYEGTTATEWNKRILSSYYDPAMGDDQKLREISEDLIICKDPRFMSTLGTWIEAGSRIDGIIYCDRNKSDAIQAGSLSGLKLVSEDLNILYRTIVERMLFNLADKHDIPVLILSYPYWMEHKAHAFALLQEFTQRIPRTVSQYEEAFYKIFKTKQDEIDFKIKADRRCI